MNDAASALSALLFTAFALVIPFLIGRRAFRIAPANRPWVVTWILTCIGGYVVWLICTMIAVGLGVGFGGMFDGFLILALAPIGAGIAGAITKPDSARTSPKWRARPKK